MNENLYDIAPKKEDDGLRRQNALDAKQTVNQNNEPTRVQSDAEATDYVNPDSQSGMFWKSQFEGFKARSTSQIRTVIDQMLEAQKEARLLRDTLTAKDVQINDLRGQLSEVQDTLKWERESYAESKRTSRPEKDTPTPEEVFANFRNGEPDAGPRVEKRNAEDDDLALLRTSLGFSRERVSQLEAENMHFKQSLAKIKNEIHEKAAVYEPQRLKREAALKKREAYLQEVAQRYRQNYKEAAQQREDAQLAVEDLQKDRSDLEAEVQSLRRKLGIFSLSTGVVSAQDMSETIQDQPPQQQHLSKTHLPPDDFTMTQTQDITATRDFLS